MGTCSMRQIRFAQVILCLGLLLSVGFAKAAAPEFEFLPAYPNANLERSDQQEVPEYRLILGKLRVIGNQIRSPEQWLNGRLTRLTYRIPPGHGSRAAFDFYRTQLNSLGAEILFSCVARDCGSSSEWAIDVFRIAELYGLDREQNYLVARVRQEQSQYYVVLYTIVRGNQRVYAHLDVVETDTSGGGNSVTERMRPVIPLNNDEFMARLPEVLADYVAQAAQAPDQNLWVVVHTQGVGYSEAVKRGESIAERVKLWLVSRGIDQSRVKALAVGPLAPAHDPAVAAERVEFFLLQD